MKAVAAGILQHVSASQLNTFTLCWRRWFFEKVLQVPVPSGEAADAGSDVHRQMDGYYTDGTLPQHASARRIIETETAPPRHDLVLNEVPRDYVLGIELAGVPVRGRIDLLDVRHETVADIWDWKTRGDLRYSKSEEELLRDVQMNLYGKYVFTWYPHQRVRFHHANLKRESVRGVFKVVEPKEELTKAEIDSFLSSTVEPVVREMKTIAGCTTHNDVKPNWSSCYAFHRPCPFWETCSKSADASVFMSRLFKEEDGMGTGLKEKLSDDTMFTKALEAGRYAGTAASTAPEGLTLYINAMPIKGVEKVTHLDEIIAAASKEICAAKKVLDLRMIAYGEGKALLAAGLRQNPPSGVVVATTGELSDVAIEALLPLANVVIRGTR